MKYFHLFSDVKIIKDLHYLCTKMFWLEKRLMLTLDLTIFIFN